MNYSALLAAPGTIQFTAWKYFNRFKYRATPFGELAAFSTLKFADNNKNALIEIERGLLNHHFIDWSLKDSTDSIREILSTQYDRNSTLY